MHARPPACLIALALAGAALAADEKPAAPERPRMTPKEAAAELDAILSGRKPAAPAAPAKAGETAAKSPADGQTAAQKAAAELDAILGPAYKLRKPPGEKGAKEEEEEPEPPPPPVTIESKADDHWLAFGRLLRAGKEEEAKAELRETIAKLETASPETKYRLANILMAGRMGLASDPDSARRLLAEAAEGGFGRAQFDYGWALVNGGFGFKADPAKGQTLLVALAEKAELQLPEARHQVALMIFRGAPGVRQDPVRALRLLGTLAAMGYPPSELEMGRAMMNGIPPLLPADPERGVGLLKLAATSGLPQAAYTLAEACEKGLGTPVDPVEALRYYRQARAGGMVMAQLAIERLEPVVAKMARPAPKPPAPSAGKAAAPAPAQPGAKPAVPPPATPADKKAK